MIKDFAGALPRQAAGLATPDHHEVLADFAGALGIESTHFRYGACRNSGGNMHVKTRVWSPGKTHQAQPDACI